MYLHYKDVCPNIITTSNYEKMLEWENQNRGWFHQRIHTYEHVLNILVWIWQGNFNPFIGHVVQCGNVLKYVECPRGVIAYMFAGVNPTPQVLLYINMIEESKRDERVAIYGNDLFYRLETKQKNYCEHLLTLKSKSKSRTKESKKPLSADKLKEIEEKKTEKRHFNLIADSHHIK